MTDLSGSAGVQNTRGILAMIGAMVAFTATDASMKLATETLPPSQVIVVRGVIATPPRRQLSRLFHGDMAVISTP